jgi:hypothetical protein
MNLIGTRYATFHAGPWLVKAQDLKVPDRLPVICYREALACALGTRLGLTIPVTHLVEHPEHGRIATQPWLDHARPPSPQQLADLRFAPTGIRILLLDLLIANSDRRDDNLLDLGGTIAPIDFNVSCAFAREGGRYEPPDMTIMRWFGTAGVLGLPRDGLATLTGEIERFEHLISEPYLHFACERLPDAFIDELERKRLVQALVLRRRDIGAWLRDWWHRTVEPFHRLNEANHD